MDKKNGIIGYNPCKNRSLAKVLYIKDYFERREMLKNRREEQEDHILEKSKNNITYLDEDRQKTLDLFVKVLNTMKKENFQ